MIIEYGHKTAAHCENGSTSGLLSHHGIKLSEPLIFGIGSGCFFSYLPFYKVNGLPVISFRHWPGVIFRRATEKLGVSIERRTYRDPQKAMQDLNHLIDSGIPVGMRVGVFYLSYFPPEYRFHFNAHNLVAFGREDDRYYISDPVMENVETLTYKELERVRFARGTHPPKGSMYWITGTPEVVDLPNAIKEGIKLNCNHMLRIPIPLFGVNGIRYIAGRIKKWDKRFGGEKAALYLGQFIRMLEEIGTGGAGFRFMYAAFLQEAAGILNIPAMTGLSEEMTHIGDNWREFASRGAKNLRNRGVPPTPYPELSEMLYKLAAREEKLFRDLEHIIRS